MADCTKTKGFVMSKEAMKLALVALTFDGFTPEDATHRNIHAKAIKALEEALAKQEQEPVAYINIEKRRLEWAHDYMSWDTPTVVNLPRIPLYTTPPQRAWVGLTDEDYIDWDGTGNLKQLVEAIEAKLKEKNA
jgi:hypothetical protein